MRRVNAKDQWASQNLAQDFYLPTTMEAFLVDRKAQSIASETIYFYHIKLKLFAGY